MARIFGNSFLTISATISEDALGVIFRRIPQAAGHVKIPHHVISTSRREYLLGA